MTENPITNHDQSAGQYTDWNDLREELMQEVGPERLAKAKAELHDYLHAYHDGSHADDDKGEQDAVQ